MTSLDSTVPNAPVVKGSQHFLKIILQSIIEDKKLMLPPKFVKKHGNELSDVAKITSPDGCIWQVGITKSGNSAWFDCGWPKFVEDYSIHHGYLLVFEYKGMSDFKVLIFDMSACEVQYQSESTSDISLSAPGSEHMRMNKRHKCDPSLDPKSEHDYQTSKKINTNEASRNDEMDASPKCEKQSKIITTRNFDQILANIYPRSERAGQPCHPAMLYHPKSISFMFVYRKHNNRSLYMPHSFGKHLDRASEYIKVLVTDGGEWLIRTFWRETGSVELAAGLAKFSRDNSLEEGDICFFEPIMLKTVALRATIFHATSCGSVPKARMHKKNSASVKTSDFENIYDRRKGCKKEEKITRTIVINDANESVERKSNRNGVVQNNKADGSELSAKDEETIIASSRKFNFSVETCEKSKKALQTARMLKPTNPSFMVIVHESNFQKCFMYVPAEFAWKYLNGVPEHLAVQSSDCEKWIFRTKWREHGGMFMQSGGTNFFKDNKLTAGDICVFELIEPKKFVLKLTIFRAT